MKLQVLNNESKQERKQECKQECKQDACVSVCVPGEERGEGRPDCQRDRSGSLDRGSCVGAVRRACQATVSSGRGGWLLMVNTQSTSL